MAFFASCSRSSNDGRYARGDGPTGNDERERETDVFPFSLKTNIGIHDWHGIHFSIHIFDNVSDYICNTEAKKCAEFSERTMYSETGMERKHKSRLIVSKNVQRPPSIVHTRPHFSR